MNWKIWLHSLAAAALGGAVTAVTAYFADPNNFNFTTAGLQKLAGAVIVGALTAVVALLKQSPIQKQLPAPTDPATK